MLRHLISKQEVENRRNFPKNNYFSYQWRVKDHFNKSIDRQMFHLSVHGADNHKSLMNHKVLQLHKSRFTGNRRDLVVNLAQDAMAFLDKRREEHSKSSKEQVLYSSSMTGLVENSFNLLLSCATELNTILGLSELFITATEPNLEVQDKTKETVCSYTQCRFSTSLFSLVMEGRRERIKFYVVPADELISMDEVGVQYEAVSTWVGKLHENGDVTWKSQGMELNDDMLEISAIQLLGKLIDKTKERLTPVEKQEKADQEYALFEEDPWMKENDIEDASIGYKTSNAAVETATSTTINSLPAIQEVPEIDEVQNAVWNTVSDDAKAYYANQNPLELQTLECEPIPEVIYNPEPILEEKPLAEEKASKQTRIPRKSKKKLSRRMRKKQAKK